MKVLVSEKIIALIKTDCELLNETHSKHTPELTGRLPEKESIYVYTATDRSPVPPYKFFVIFESEVNLAAAREGKKNIEVSLESKLFRTAIAFNTAEKAAEYLTDFSKDYNLE